MTDEKPDDVREEGQKVAMSVHSLLKIVNEKIMTVRAAEGISGEAEFILKATFIQEKNPPPDMEIPEGQVACGVKWQSFEPNSMTAKEFSNGMGEYKDGEMAKIMMLGNALKYSAIGSIGNNWFFESRTENNEEDGEATFDLRITTQGGMKTMVEAGGTSIYDFVEQQSKDGSPNVISSDDIIDLGQAVLGNEEPINLRERTQ